jgi:hypothetical protein
LKLVGTLDGRLFRRLDGVEVGHHIATGKRAAQRKGRKKFHLNRISSSAIFFFGTRPLQQAVNCDYCTCHL